MNMLATESPESATARADAGMRPWMVGITLLAALLLCGMLGALVMEIKNQASAGLTPQKSIVWMLALLAGLLVLMALIVMRRAAKLWGQAKTGAIGTRLQSRIIVMFCVIAILPTIIVSVFSGLFFNFGVQAWFDSRVSSALEDSVTVASAYLDEHKTAIRTDAQGLGTDVARNLSQIYSNVQLFEHNFTRQTYSRNLSEAVLFDRSRVLARTALSFSLVFERLPEQVMDRADQGNAVIFGDDENKIQAVVKVSDMPEMYLLVGRVVDPTVLQHMKAARTTVVEYRQLQHDINRLQKQFFAVFVLVALLILLASIWAGMALATRLIGPIAGLMSATERVRAGDYSIKVPEGRANDEIANLGRTFNRMTGQLEAQRRDIMEANRQLDERRRFSEAVLSGVSAGVIALDSEYRITLNNRTATQLLGVKGDVFGRVIGDVLPDVKELITQVERAPSKIASANISLQDGEKRVNLHVQVTAERLGETIEGYIVTFDDITELVSAQRNAAWSDVARRIAHEIKNPLTPITLSVDRLRKKFGAEISSDKEGYERYLETISRHVRDIGRMVEEFVAFARLPAATFREEDVVVLLRKAVFSEKTVNEKITYTLDAPDHPVKFLLDESQLGQTFLNLMKNAAEAMDTTDGKKEIRITVKETDSQVVIVFEDSGPGFPPENIARLTEPYVTTRTKGTGLGLAIVKRSVEEHKGTLVLANRPEGGASVTMNFARA